jgi:FkbM family methyltransferase
MSELTPPKHHEVFYNFKCWEGIVQPGYQCNFLGNLIRSSFSKDSFYYKEPTFVSTEYPPFDEEYFEWIDVLESVIAAKDDFLMIELGAGYGRWLIRAAKAFHQVKDRPFLLIGVEAEPDHYKWMKLHFTDNGINPVFFHVGDPHKSYGQHIASTGIPPSSSIKEVKAISLNSLLHLLEKVDLIDLDVQGAEFLVLSAAVDELNKKVKRVHIGTHHPSIESQLRVLFTNMGWKCLQDYPISKGYPTPYGLIDFVDGVQTWVNPQLI